MRQEWEERARVTLKQPSNVASVATVRGPAASLPPTTTAGPVEAYGIVVATAVVDWTGTIDVVVLLLATLLVVVVVVVVVTVLEVEVVTPTLPSEASQATTLRHARLPGAPVH